MNKGLPERILFVTNICAHYRVKTFETLAERVDTEFVFFSDGGEKYWDPKHGVKLGNFKGGYLNGIRIFGVRFTPGLLSKLIFGQHDIIIKCITGRFALPVTYMIARARGKPFILWTNLWYHPDTVFHKLTFPITKWIYRHADAVVTFGSHIQKYLLELGVDAQRVFVSTQAVDGAIFGKAVSSDNSLSLLKALGLKDQQVILYVGRFDPIKGLEYVVQSLALISADLKAHLVLVGDGETKAAIRELAEKMNLSRQVSFVDYVSNDELYKYYSLASVFVLPSITLRNVKEVWGLVINEAMNQGCPVVATDAVGAAVGGLLQNGITGLVVPERNAQAFANAIEKILDNRDLRESMRKAALEEIQHWTYDRQVEGFTNAIEFVTSMKAHA